MESVSEITLPATVMLQGRTDVPPYFAMHTERGASVGRGMGDNLRTHGRKGSAVEVELTEERGVSRKRRMDTRGTEKVQSQRGLRKKAIPFSERELGIDSAEDGNKVVFKSANSTVCSVDAVLLGRHTLELDVVFRKSVLEVLRAFVVENV